MVHQNPEALAVEPSRRRQAAGVVKSAAAADFTSPQEVRRHLQ
jgi:hypothetical protein